MGCSAMSLAIASMFSAPSKSRGIRPENSVTASLERRVAVQAGDMLQRERFALA